VLSLLLGATCNSAAAATISFIEPRDEGPVKATLDISECGTSCFNVTQQGDLETGVVRFSAPPTFFDIPAGTIRGQVTLIEPGGIPGEIGGTVSDVISITISKSVNPAAPIGVEALFSSLTEPDIQFPQPGVPVITETGKLQNISGSFYNPNGLSPVNLPSNLTILVQSDVVPEPSSVLLFGAGLLGLAIARKRLS